MMDASGTSAIGRSVAVPGHPARDCGRRALAIIVFTWCVFAPCLPLRGEEPFDIRRATWTTEILAYRAGLREERPVVRGFRAAILDRAADAWPAVEPGLADSSELRRAADIVARRLAFDGLVLTTAAAIEALGPQRFAAPDSRGVEELKRVGLPVDLLTAFLPPGATDLRPDATIAYIAQRLRPAGLTEALRDELRGISFRFHASAPSFRAASDTGEWDVGLLRLQASSDHYYLGPGDGGAMDLLRQLVALHPSADVILSVQDVHVAGLRRLASEWGLAARAPRIRVLVEPLPVSQWAQDNGRAGTLTGDNGVTLRATLVPRYASRGEDGSTFVPGESFLMDSIAAAEHSVFQSPLIFQGGDLLMVNEGGRRVLLIGEGEVYRNTALGLTAAQAIEAFRVEMGADECLVLPACSYHIDYEVSIRATLAGVVVLVNDPVAAAKRVLAIGCKALEAWGAMKAAEAASCIALLAGARAAEAVDAISAVLDRRAVGPGQWPESLANAFSTGPVDSGVGNIQRFLLARDVLRAAGTSDEVAGVDTREQAYLDAIRRSFADREEMISRLAARAWRIARIPSFGEPGRGMNYLNGLHEPGRYLMPAYGGLYAPLDAEAAKAISAALGEGVHVVPVLSSESQRRVGAVRCSASIYPKL